MTPIQISFSKTKSVLLLLAALGFVIAGIWFVIDPASFADRGVRQYPEPIIFLIGIISVLFFGAGFIIIFKKLFSGKPALILNDDGITDNTSATSVGLIEWGDVIGVNTFVISSTKLLVLEVNDPEKYINRSKSGISKRALQHNFRRYTSPVVLNVNNLAMKYDKVVELIERELSKRKGE